MFVRFGNSDCPSDYSIDGKSIAKVDSVRDLGIIVDRKLLFKNHCLNVVKKASFLSHNVLRFFKFCDPKVKYFISRTYVLPVILYNIEFYYPTSKTHKFCLESVQRRFSKRVYPPGLNYDQWLQLLSEISIESKHKTMLLTFMYKIKYSDFRVDGFNYDNVHNITRGSSSKIVLPFCRTNVRKQFPFLRCILLWNDLAPDTSDLVSLAAFRRFLRKNVPEPQA